MAIASLNDLKQGHLYRFKNINSVGVDANSYIVFYSVGKVVTNDNFNSASSSVQCIGNKGNSYDLAKFYYAFNSRIYVFRGEFYFVFKEYVGTPTNLLSYIDEVKDFFVYDRTQADVDYAKSVIANKDYSLIELKGCLNAFDLARIESNMQMLWEELDEWGYQMTSLTFKVDWGFADYLDNTNITRILNNINSIADEFYRPQGWKTMPTTIKSYDDVNKIEKNIYLMKTALDEIQANAYRSGAFNSYTRNNEYYILPLRVE